MPKLWTETVETHRREVREAIMEAGARLAARDGPLSVTMSAIADQTRIGRATLYKYFSDVESILTAWHEHQVRRHIDELVRIREQNGDPMARLRAVLEAYAVIAHRIAGHRDTEFGAFLHRGHERTSAHGELRRLVVDLLRDAAAAGFVRTDVPADELAGYCISALSSSRHATARGGVRRLVAVVIDGLRGAPPTS